MADLSFLSVRELMDVVINHKKYHYSIERVQEALEELKQRGENVDALSTIGLQLKLDVQSNSHTLETFEKNKATLIHFAKMGIILSITQVLFLIGWILTGILNVNLENLTILYISLMFLTIIFSLAIVIWNIISFVKMGPFLDELLIDDKMDMTGIVRYLGPFLGSFLLIYLVKRKDKLNKRGW